MSTYIGTVAVADARGDVAAMYERQQAHWGYVPNYARAFSHRPEVLARWGQLLAEIKRPLPKRLFELLTFAAAHELRNTPCTLAHGRALREFYADAQIVALATGRAEDVLDARELAMVAFARRVARDATTVTRAEVDALCSLGWSDADIFDAAAVAAGRAFFTKLLDGLGVTTDAAAFAELDTPLRAALRPDVLTAQNPVDRQEPR